MHIADPRQVPAGIFAYTLHPVRPSMMADATPEERALAGRQWAYSQQLLASGALVFAGRTLVMTPESFALVVLRAESAEAAQEIAMADPAVAGGLFRATVYPYQPMLMGGWPPEAAEAPSS